MGKKPAYLKKLEGLRFFLAGRDVGELVYKDTAIQWIQMLGGAAEVRLSRSIDYYISASAFYSPTKQDQRVVSWNREAGADISILSPGSLVKLLRPTPYEALELLRGESSIQRVIGQLPAQAFQGRRINLTKQDLSGWKLRGLDFVNVCLDGATLDQADLRGSAFWALKRASLKGANLARVMFVEKTSSCDFSGADLTGAELLSVRACTFTGSKLSNAELGGDLRKCVFDGANGRSVCFRYADARGRIFKGMDLRGALFQCVDFTGANFTGCNLAGAKIYDCVMEGAKFFECKLSRALSDL